MITTIVSDIIEGMRGSITLDFHLHFDHERTVRRVKAYRQSKYLDRGDQDPLFWNLGQSRAHHFAKNIDLDTKDLRPYGTGEASYVQVWILEMKFHKWLNDSRYALRMNDISQGIADFGSHIQKSFKRDGKNIVESVNLSNIFFDPIAENIRETPKVEVHSLTEVEIKAMSGAWDDDAIEELLKEKPKVDLHVRNDDPDKYEIWEYWGVYEGEFQVIIGSGYDESGHIILFQANKKKKDDPYHDYHNGPYQGRWLRIGVYERLFELQQRINQLVNQNIEVSQIASLLLLRTNNPEIQGNVLTDAINGQVLQSNDLQQIAIDNRALGAFLEELRLIENQADKLAFTPEVISGDALPSATPFRSVATISQAAKSSFKYIKEYYGAQLSFFLQEFVFPSVVKGWNSEELVDIARDEADVRIYNQQARKSMRWKTFVDNILNGKIVSLEDLEQVDTLFEEGIESKAKKIKHPKNFFNFDYQIRTNITGENMNKSTQNEALFNFITMTSQNPAMVNTPAAKQYAELNGINWWRLTPEEQQQIQEGGAIGGKPIGSGQDKLLAAAEAE